MIRILSLVLFVSVVFGQSSFPGLNSWTFGQTVGLAGGGYLFSNNSGFRNAAMLPDTVRHFKINLVKYPAGINGQTIMTNGKINGHRIGLKISRLNYGIFEGRNIDNQLTGDYSAGDIHVQVMVAKPSNSGRFIVGINSGIFLSQIEQVSAKAFTLSPGVVFKSRIGKIGLTIENTGMVYDSYTENNEVLPAFIVSSISSKIPKTPLEFELDYAYPVNSETSIITLSGLLHLRNGIMIKGGTSTKKSGLMTSGPFIKDLFADMGVGVSYKIEDILIDINSYSYGPGGIVFAFGISVRY
ncbi:MAG: hypothetical protein ISR82_04945 [Candidatus Marinimicrobia bacterium]|nr:hypothetical protein [Candidatus Neomarinimicrobiota bacterium]MBL7010546.1 hypothetical protein [Candidatus Neomarinimicrobiota bacterium]MBL7030515.1 hypothetical protein [Candidatus Neomarinimicrobiota bacterium]